MVVVTIGLCLGTIGMSFFNALEVSKYANAVDYVQQKFGVNASGALWSFFSATAAIGTIIASTALGRGLAMFGFNPKAITLTAQLGIRIVVFIVPAICALIAILFQSLVRNLDIKKAE